MARALKQLSLGVPTESAPEVRTAIVQTGQRSVSPSLDEPRSGFGNMEGLIELDSPEDFLRELAALLFAGCEKKESAGAESERGRYRAPQNEQGGSQKGTFGWRGWL